MELNLEKFEVDGKEYPIRENLSNLLRSPGVFKDINDVAEAILLASKIRDTENDILELDAKQAHIMRITANRHLELTFEGRSLFGGITHEECIIRIVNMMKKSGD